MGLRQGVSGHENQRGDALKWAVAALILLVVLLGLLGDAGRDWLRFDRDAIAGGEFWRVITAHFVHLDASHLVLNLAGLALIAYLVGRSLPLAEWALTLAVACITVSAGLWALLPDLERYVGLSGVLHGLLTAGLVATIGRWSIDSWVVAVAVAAKLLYEQVSGPLPSSEGLTGGSVIVDAHLYGAVSGCITGAVAAIRVRAQASI